DVASDGVRADAGAAVMLGGAYVQQNASSDELAHLLDRERAEAAVLGEHDRPRRRSNIALFDRKPLRGPGPHATVENTHCDTAALQQPPQPRRGHTAVVVIGDDKVAVVETPAARS